MKREKLIKYGLAVALALMLALPFAALTGRAPSAGAAGESDEAVEILQTRISPDIGAGAPFSLSLTTETGAGTLQTHAGMWQISDGCETEGNAYKAAITQENYDGLTGVFKFQTPVTTNNTVVSANAIKFAQPIVIAESNGIDIKLRINAEYKSEFNNWFGAYLYGKGALTPPTGGDWTTFGHTGYRIYQEIPNTGWNILRIPKSELYKLADADDAAKISMIQFSMGCIASPTQAFYIAEIYPLEMTGPSGTLTGSYGYNYTNIGYSVTSNWYFNISEVTGAGAMGAASAYKTDFVCWGVSLTENVLVLDEPVKADEISLMAMIRVYAHLSDGTPYNTARGGVRLYPLDATGMDTASGYMIPAAIQQDTWVDLMLTKGDFAKLADADGWVRGIQFGCAVITGERNEFYNNHAEAYIMIEYLALYNEMPYKYHSDFVLTGYESPTGSSTLTQVSGFDNSSLHPVQYAWFLKDKEISLETGIDTANGFAYRMEITSWALNRSEKLLPFNRVVDIGDVEGMVMRVYAHLGTGDTYSVSRGGIRFYPLDAQGLAGEGWMLPANVSQDCWTEVVLAKDDVKKMAGADGKLRGVQIGAAMLESDPGLLYISDQGNNAYIMIDSIAVCRGKTLTYDLGGSTLTAKALTQVDLEASYYYPKKAGYLFAGWYDGPNLYDFSAKVLDDVTLTAKWVQLANSAEKAGYYSEKGGSGVIRIFPSGEFRFENIPGFSGYYDAVGVDPGGIVYIVRSDSVITLDLADYDASDYKLITYKAFGQTVETDMVNEGAVTVPYAYSHSGYLFTEWLKADGTPFAFGAELAADITLYAKLAPQGLASTAYPGVYGHYYDPVSKNRITLAAQRAATFSADGSTRTYTLLEGSVIAFSSVVNVDFVNSNYANGKITPTMLTLDGVEYIRLGEFMLSFNTGIKKPIPPGEESGAKDEYIVNYITVNSIYNGGSYKVIKPNDPVLAGMVFKGWALSVNGELVLYDFDSVVYRPMELFAVWEQDQDYKPDKELLQTEKEKDGGCNGKNSIAPLIFGFTALLAVAVRRRVAR